MVEAGVAQAPREETAENRGCGSSRVKRYRDLTGGTGMLSGNDMGPRAGDRTEVIESAVDGAESLPYSDDMPVIFHRMTKPSAIGAGYWARQRICIQTRRRRIQVAPTSLSLRRPHQGGRIRITMEQCLRQ
jgi:hypothetical protein